MKKHYFLLFTFLIFTLEISSFSLFKILNNKSLMFTQIDLMSEQDFIEYKKNTSSLGWPNEEKQQKLLEKNADSCIDVFGDSFIYGIFDNLKEDEIWSSHLEKKLGCRIGNYGISGYGNDQAYLFFDKINKTSKTFPKHIFFSITSINIQRNLNRFRGILRGHYHPASKPRFIFRNENIELLEKENLTYEAYRRLYDSSETCPQYEEFCHIDSYLNMKVKFPYSFSVPYRLFQSIKLKAFLKGQSLHQYLYYNNSYNAVDILSHIAHKFFEDTKKLKISSTVVLIPTATDLKFIIKKNKSPFEALIKYFQKNNIAYIDFSTELLNDIKISNQRPDDYYYESGHFSHKAHQLFSEFLLKNISKN